MRYKKNKQYRLRGFDYAEAGEYFITICVKDRKRYLGKIIDEKITLSSIGKIVDKVWNSAGWSAACTTPGAMNRPEPLKAIPAPKATEMSKNRPKATMTIFVSRFIILS